MNKLLPIVAACLAMSLAACKSNDTAVSKSSEVATNAAPDKIKKKKAKDLRCRSEAPTGSRIAKMKCTTKKQRQARSRTKTALDQVIQGQVGAMKGPIGGGN